MNEGSFLLSAARYVGIDLGERVQIELVRWCLGPAGQEAFGIRMGINRFDALDGATTFQKRTHRIIQLLMRAGSSTFDFESSEGVLVKVGHGVNSGYNSYAGPKPRAEEREGWDGRSIPHVTGQERPKLKLLCPVHARPKNCCLGSKVFGWGISNQTATRTAFYCPRIG